MRFTNFYPYRHILFSRRFPAALWRSRRNILSDVYGLPLPFGPFMAELDVTYRCDARCRMCERWKDQRRDELKLDDYGSLAEAFSRMGVYLVSLAGGEPLLREDIFSIIETFAQKDMKVNVCTNGITLEKRAESLSRSGASFITVSLDGDREDTHDQIRGVPGSYRKIMKGMELLLGCPQDNRPRVRVRMTLCNQNVGEIGSYYRRWHGLVDDVLFQPVHECREAFYTGREKDAFRLDPSLLKRELESANLGDDRYLDRLVSSFTNEGTFPPHYCYAGTLMTRIDPWGNVYPCLEQHIRVGSLENQNFQTIWNSRAFSLARRHIAEKRECRCWYNNTALISHYAKILKGTSATGFFAELQCPSLVHNLKGVSVKNLVRARG